ncbi:hypothetical protein [Chroococcidiopsis sp.]|uniref:hypothetical protein n=1 Tax=Chroococcidiopsis sp. TaxID=3088168 RepID=UPI003F3AAB1D
MAEPKNLVGTEKGQLFIKALAGKDSRGHLWECICSCGNTQVIPQDSLSSKKGKICCDSCTNSRKGLAGLKHGYQTHPAYETWRGMIKRCYEPKTNGYKNYGGREVPITVCDEWRESIESFIIWLNNANWKPGLEIDRINNDGSYCPENCTLVTSSENCRKRRNTRYITVGEETKSVAYFAEKYNIDRYLVYQRLNQGWNPEDALTLPSNRGRKLSK